MAHVGVSGRWCTPHFHVHPPLSCFHKSSCNLLQLHRTADQSNLYSQSTGNVTTYCTFINNILSTSDISNSVVKSKEKCWEKSEESQRKVKNRTQFKLTWREQSNLHSQSAGNVATYCTFINNIINISGINNSTLKRNTKLRNVEREKEQKRTTAMCTREKFKLNACTSRRRNQKSSSPQFHCT